jgi:hypothetical protein
MIQMKSLHYCYGPWELPRQGHEQETGGYMWGQE